MQTSQQRQTVISPTTVSEIRHNNVTYTWCGLVVSTLSPINTDALRQVRLLLGQVTVCRQANYLSM